MARMDEARLLRREVIEAKRRHVGDEHESKLIAEFLTAEILTASRMTDEAIELMKHDLEVQQRVLGPAHAHTRWTSQYLTNLT
jgi:hypothetical protein